ncbi:MAG: zf-TFIIB domain-containing protein [Desulfomonilaceae bacterium]|nr:zf-TFIIB domain-containing protein [Desulfomonilaceae bacterium]
MSARTNRKRVKLKAFLADYVRGASEEELREKHDLRHSQVGRVVGILKKRGEITSKEEALRVENLKIRFGRSENLPSSATYRKKSVELDSGLVLHCPSCGAAVERGAVDCAYCGSRLDFSFKGKTIHCPHCFKTTTAEGKFCVHCARPVKGLVTHGKVLEDRPCPRCSVPMYGLNMGDFSVIQCDECKGVFVPHETFETMQETRDAVIVSSQGVSRVPAEPEKQVAYVRCPICLKMMNRTNFARISGVIIDTCRDHGIWFDHGEVEKVMDFVARGGLQKAKAVEMERLKHQDDLRRIRNLPTGQRAEGRFHFDPADDPMAGVSLFDVVGRLFSVLRK